MRSLRYSIKIDGVDVQMLFTPHLYSFVGVQGVTFEVADRDDHMEIYEAYADIMFCAALNAWVLDGHGTPDDFRIPRGDFHAFMTLHPEAFVDAVYFAVEALTGKSVRALREDAATGAETTKDAETADVGGKKKRCSRWIGTRSRRSS